ncbi:hypothetical protein QYZ88_012280 [Lachnospiraceae bacterium C1.1]|nr:hypothetical protein [Lachnospiraceae bacterium C1.1]
MNEENNSTVNEKENKTVNTQVQESIIDAYATSIVSYIGVIGLILSFCIGDKKDPFALRHINQALVLSIGDIALISCTISGFFFLPEVVVPFMHIFQLLLFALRVIGFITAVQKKNSELPIVGKIKLIK